MRNKWIGGGLLLLILLLLIGQFYPLDRSIPKVGRDEDFLLAENAPEDVQLLFKRACYDCHSYQTKYPWYAHVSPLRLWIQNHIVQGREHLNFSTWTQYEFDKRKHKLEECIEEIEEDKMPLKSYTWLHKESDFTVAQKERIIQFLKERVNEQ